MTDLQQVIRKAGDNLNRALAEYENTSSPLALEFYELKLQACIFQFDICAEMAGLINNQSTGFAASVALKGLVLRLYEYDQLINKHLVVRFLAIARTRGMDVDRQDIRLQRKQWRSELSRLQQWSDVRNEAAGHYGKNLSRQVQLLKELDINDVLAIAQAFLRFNMYMLKILRAAGRASAA